MKTSLINTESNHSRLPAIGSLISLVLLSLLLAGCAASRSYPGPVHGLTFNGTIQSIDLQNRRLTLSPLKPGEPVFFLWDDNTKFWKNDVPIRPDSVEPGRSVRVHYHATADLPVAHHVYIQVPYAPLH